MAKNWKVFEVVREIQANNPDVIFDCGRRFPLFTAYASSGNVEGLIRILEATPDHLTVRKVESVLKENVQPIEEEVEAAEETKKEPEKKTTGRRGRPKKQAEEVDDDVKEEPKKRGRKPKPTPEPEVEEWDEDEVEETEDDDDWDL